MGPIKKPANTYVSNTEKKARTRIINIDLMGVLSFSIMYCFLISGSVFMFLNWDIANSINNIIKKTDLLNVDK